MKFNKNELVRIFPIGSIMRPKGPPTEPWYQEWTQRSAVTIGIEGVVEDHHETMGISIELYISDFCKRSAWYSPSSIEFTSGDNGKPYAAKIERLELMLGPRIRRSMMLADPEILKSWIALKADMPYRPHLESLDILIAGQFYKDTSDNMLRDWASVIRFTQSPSLKRAGMSAESTSSTVSLDTINIKRAKFI